MSDWNYNIINFKGGRLEKSSDLLFGLGHLLCRSSVIYQGRILTSKTDGLDPRIVPYLLAKEKLESLVPWVFGGALLSIPLSIIKHNYSFGNHLSPALIHKTYTITQFILGLFVCSFVVGGYAKTLVFLLKDSMSSSNQESFEIEETPSKFLTRKTSIIHELWKKRKTYTLNNLFPLDIFRGIIDFADNQTLHHLESVSHSIFILCQEEWMKRAKEKINRCLPIQIKEFLCITSQKQNFNKVDFPLFRYSAKRKQSGGTDESSRLSTTTPSVTQTQLNAFMKHFGGRFFLVLDWDENDKDKDHWQPIYQDYLQVCPKSWPLLQVHEEIVQRHRPCFFLYSIKPEDMGNESIVYGLDCFDRVFVAIRFVAKFLRKGKEISTECVGILHQAAQMHSRDWIWVMNGVVYKTEKIGTDWTHYFEKAEHPRIYQWAYALKGNEDGNIDQDYKYYLEWFQRLFNGEKCMWPGNHTQLDRYIDVQHHEDACQITLWKRSEKDSSKVDIQTKNQSLLPPINPILALKILSVIGMLGLVGYCTKAIYSNQIKVLSGVTAIGVTTAVTAVFLKIVFKLENQLKEKENKLTELN